MKFRTNRRRAILVLVSIGALALANNSTSAQGIGAIGTGAASASSAAATATTTAAAAAPPIPTIFDFLGVPQIAHGICNIGKKGLLGLKRLSPFGNPPPPAGAGEGEPQSPGAKAVSQDIKAKEAAKADAQAIEYLATVGCGNCNPDVEETLYHGLDSCFPAVRAAAARTVRIASSKGCPGCNKTSCCSPRIQERLMRLGYGVDESGCPFESDVEVSRQCRLAFACCQCNSTGDVLQLQPFAEGPPLESEYLPPPSESTSSKKPKTMLDVIGDQSHGVPWARVNDEPIFRSQILRRVEAALLYDRSDRREQRRQDLIEQELAKAVENRLIAQAARNDRFLMIGMAEDFADDLERDAALTEQYLRVLPVDDRISQEDIKVRYDQNRDAYRSSASLLVEELRIPVTSDSQARHVLACLLNRTAKPSSESLPVRREDLVALKPRWIDTQQIQSAGLYDKLGSLQRGQFSDVLPVSDGYCVFRVLERKASRRLSLEEARPLVRRELMQQRAELARDNVIRFLREQSNYWDIHSGVHLTDEASPSSVSAIEASYRSIRR